MAEDPLSRLRSEHPRLLATHDDWTRLRQFASADPEFSALNTALITAARKLLSEPPLRRELVGRRMLGVSRDLVQRLFLLGYAWRMTGEKSFAERAEVEMGAAAAFPDWNPPHFLDVAEATAALAIGYDWCYDALTPEARAAIRRAIAGKGLRPGLDPATPDNFWHHASHNWNQVCFGGMTLGALAIGEDEPGLARDVLTLARANIAHGLAPYGPDGVYPEGPSYWGYGTTYQALMIAALESALGTDWGLAAHPGFLASVGGYLQATGPRGNFFNFADGGERGAIAPVIFWFAGKLEDTGLLLFEKRHLASWLHNPDRDLPDNFLPLVAVWWLNPGKAAHAPALPLRWTGRGANPIAVLRESWTDPASLYLALKGGAAELNHAHMDAGSFVFEADGVRWAVDLGAQDYESLESKHIDLWNRAQDSQRWQVYRLNNQSHNTLTIDGQPHRVDGHAVVTHFSSDASNFYAIVDLSPVFGGQAARVRRGFRLLPHRRVLIEDELTGLAPGTRVRWQMLTRAEISPAGRRATLRQDGRLLDVDLLQPDQVRLDTAPAEPPADGFDAPNPGVSILSATAAAPADGALRFALVLSPGAAGAATPELEPLASWIRPGDRVQAP